MSRALTIFVVLSALATGSAIVLGLVAEPLGWGEFGADFVRAVAVVSWIVGALVWCTERICREVSTLRMATSKQIAALREELAASNEVLRKELMASDEALRETLCRTEKSTQKRLRALESLTRERIEAAHQVKNVLELRQRRANDR